MAVNVLQCLCQGVQAHVSDIHGNEVATELSRDSCQQSCLSSCFISVSVADVTVEFCQVDAELLIALTEFMDCGLSGALSVRVSKGCSHKFLKGGQIWKIDSVIQTVE